MTALPATTTSPTPTDTAGLRRGRWTHTPRDVVVFQIGMRITSPHRVDAWGPVFTAFPRMLKTLATDPDSGLLGYHLWFGRTTLSLQYWDSMAKLHAFAADPAQAHLAAWRRFMRAGTDGHVGIWHETYQLRVGDQESLYHDMPAFGLGGALGGRPITPGLRTAKQRLASRG